MYKNKDMCGGKLWDNSTNFADFMEDDLSPMLFDSLSLMYDRY